MIILLISLSLRLAVLAVINVSLMDETTFRRQLIATNVVEGRGYTFCSSYFPFCGPNNDQTASVGPAPVLFYAALIIVFGNLATKLAIALQILLGLTTIVLLYKIIIELFGSQRVALLGALMWGAYVPMIRSELDLAAEPIFTWFLALGVLAVLHGFSSAHLRFWILAGACFGLAALSREAFVYFPPVLGFLVILVPFVRLRQRLIKVCIFLVAFSLTLSPWIIRNALVFNGFVPGSTLAGYNLYRHNYIIADNRYLPFVSREEADLAVAHLIEQRTDLRGDENELEMDRVYREEAIDIIKSYPHRYVLLSVYRLVPLWTDIDVRPGLSGQLLGLVNLIPLGLAVAAAIRRRGLHPYALLPVLGLIVYSTLIHMLVIARLRFMIPIMPYVIALAADQGIHLAIKLGSRLESPAVVNVPPLYPPPF
jgi:4-amino-4-deoxy-L-arabinose transferase-like glycosyltransferase